MEDIFKVFWKEWKMKMQYDLCKILRHWNLIVQLHLTERVSKLDPMRRIIAKDLLIRSLTQKFTHTCATHFEKKKNHCTKFLPSQILYHDTRCQVTVQRDIARLDIYLKCSFTWMISRTRLIIEHYYLYMPYNEYISSAMKIY